MLLIDRVVCDVCFCVVGQLFAQPAQAPDLLDKQHLIVCPDCLDASYLAGQAKLIQVGAQ